MSSIVTISYRYSTRRNNGHKKMLKLLEGLNFEKCNAAKSKLFTEYRHRCFTMKNKACFL
jgi:hypothetical protein